MAYLLLGVVAVVAVHGATSWGWLRPRPKRAAKLSPQKARCSDDKDGGEEFAYPLPPADHAYYDKIDRARQRFISGRPGSSAITAEREERVRARFRSHDPRRWRIQPTRFGSSDADFDFCLYDWAVAEKELRMLERKSGLAIQRPPLAYTDAAAKKGAHEAGYDYYFSISDFEAGLLHGSFELKSTVSDEKKITIELSEKGERTPSTIMGTMSELEPRSFARSGDSSDSSTTELKDGGARRRQSRASRQAGGDSSD